MKTTLMFLSIMFMTALSSCGRQADEDAQRKEAATQKLINDHFLQNMKLIEDHFQTSLELVSAQETIDSLELELSMCQDVLGVKH